jgi:hypothetical protein
MDAQAEAGGIPSHRSSCSRARGDPARHLQPAPGWSDRLAWCRRRCRGLGSHHLPPPAWRDLFEKRKDSPRAYYLRVYGPQPVSSMRPANPWGCHPAAPALKKCSTKWYQELYIVAKISPAWPPRNVGSCGHNITLFVSVARKCWPCRPVGRRPLPTERLCQLRRRRRGQPGKALPGDLPGRLARAIW